MKQRLLLFLASLMTLLPAWAQDTGMMGFKPSGQNNVDITELGNNQWMVVAKGNDPYAVLTPLQADLTAEQTTMKFDYKLDRDLGAGIEFFFSPFAGGREQQFALEPTSEWKTAQVDMKASINSFGWGKAGDLLRFDFGNDGRGTLILRNIRIGSYEFPDLPDLQQDEEGTCLLSTAKDLETFANYINNGQPLNGKLTADIDYKGHTTFIGKDQARQFTTVFDGQGHSITVGFEPTAENQCLFPYFAGTIRNLTVKGDINTKYCRTAGLVSQSFGGYIDNCVSLVNITSTATGDAVYGGLVSDHKSAYLYITNCLYAGTIKAPDATNCGGLLGWSGGRTTFTNCVMAGDISEMGGSDNWVFSRNASEATIKNCAYTKENGNVNANAQLIECADDCLASGELAYKANYVAGTTVFFQNIGQDAFPVPYDSHKQVYASGNVRCDGFVEGDATYSNDPASAPSHSYVDGVCSVCGGVDLNFVPQIDGVMQIGTPVQLNWLSKYVQAGYEVNAVLTADIDMDGIDFEPIGSVAHRFTGTFDGQGHRISNLKVNRPDTQGVGLFGIVTGSVVVKNFILDSTCSITGKSYGGVIGGAMTSANVKMACVGNEGNVTVSEQNGSGMFGCNDGNCALIDIRNCYVTGSIKGGREAGAFSGWAHGAYFENCWSTATVEGYESQGNSMWRGAANGVNCYSTHGQCAAIAQEDAASGRLTYLLNGGLKQNPAWYQTLETDPLPCFDSTHGLVYQAGEEYADIHDEATLNTYKERMTSEALAYVDGLVATTSLIDEYKAETEVLGAAANLDELFAELPLFEKARASVEASAAAYAAYSKKVEDTKATLEADHTFEGEHRDLLADYLYSSDEPNDQFVNGGAAYILESHELDTKDIQAETASIDKMLSDAIRFGYQTGKEATMLLTNADFTDGLNGWEGESQLNGTLKSNTTGIVGAEYYGTGAFDSHQTVTGVKNGFYVLTATAATRAFNDRYSALYNAALYMNGDNTYVPAVIEEVLPVDKAEDGVNCYLTATNAGDGSTDLEITDDDNNLVGYAMHGRTSIANAASAGRAVNYLMTEVTDGTLTVGYRKPASTNGASDWAGIANLHLYYFATLDEAQEYVGKVIAFQAARAKAIVAFEPDVVDYKTKPNCPKSIKDALTEAIAAAEATDDVQKQMELVHTFSTLFDQYLAGRQAYMTMATETDVLSVAVSDLASVSEISEAEAQKIEDAVKKVWDAYEAGSYTTEQALAMEDLKAIGCLPTIEDNVCLIENPLHMAYYSKKLNGGARMDAKLMADISYFSENQRIANFYDTLDGNNHSITLNINTSDNCGAMISDIIGGTVKNLTVKGSIVTSGQFAASIAGRTGGSETSYFTNIASYVTIESSVSGDGTHGGLLGVANTDARFTNCLFAGSIKGASTSCCGGMVGWSNSTTYFTDCLQVGTLDVDLSGCGTFSRNSGNARMTNSYYLNAYGDKPEGQVTAEQLKSGEICFALNNCIDLKPSWYQTLGEDDFPVLDATHKVVSKTEDGYSNDALSELARHKGTADDPYPLSTASEVRAMRNFMVAGQITYFTLANDIDMASVKDWQVLNQGGDKVDGNGYQNFVSLDGKGHVIKNFTCSGGNYPSFFGVLCGEVRNVGFENASVTSTSTGTGIVCSHAGHPFFVDAEGNKRVTTIENVWVTGDITCTKSFCGGLIGRVYGPTVLKNAYANVDITSTVTTGALAARVTDQFTVTNFYGAGTVPAGSGLVGTVAGKAEDAVASYTNVVVWNNTDNTFGALADNDVTTGISYYDGSNFAELQQTVVGWDAKTWSCDMQEGSYPVLTGLADGIGGVAGVGVKAGTGAIYNLNGQRVQKMLKGIYIIGGRKVLVK